MAVASSWSSLRLKAAVSNLCAWEGRRGSPGGEAQELSSRSWRREAPGGAGAWRRRNRPEGIYWSKEAAVLSSFIKLKYYFLLIS